MSTAGCTAISPLAIATGAVTLVQGKSFTKGYLGVIRPVEKALEDFGDEHATHMTQTVIGLAFAFVGKKTHDAWKQG